MFKKVNTSSLQILLLAAILHLTVSRSQAYNYGLHGCNSNNDGALLAISDYCSAYIHCLSGKAVTVSCLHGFGFSTAAMACVPLAQSDCRKERNDNAKTIDLETINSEENFQLCHSKSDGTVFPFKKACDYYYNCLSQRPIKLHCPYDMGFSSSAGGCVPRKDSDCVAVKNIISTVTQSAYFESTIRACVDNEERLENQVACYGQAFGELVPYPGDCTKFLVCNCEYPTVKDCAAGTWFDNKLKVCNFPQNVECDNSGGGLTTSSIMTTPTTSTPPPCDTSPQATPSFTTTTSGTGWGTNCATPEGMSSGICLNYENNFLLRYPYDCNAYINCTQGCPVMTYCLPDKVFNAFLKICDTPETAHCESLPMPSTTTTNEPTSTTEIRTTFSTTTWQPTTLSTTTEEATTASSTTTELTTTKQTTTTPLACVPPPGVSADICALQDPGTLLAYPYNCSAYILCNWLCPHLKYCAPNQKFNPHLGNCDSCNNVQCTEIPYPTPGTSEPTTQTTTTVTIWPETTSSRPLSCEPPYGISADICSCQYPGTLLAYPYNCSAYILCNWLCPHLKFCGPNKLYNSRLGICDSADNVQCTEMPYPTPGTSQPTTATTDTVPIWPETTTDNPFTTQLPPDVEPGLCVGKGDYEVYPYAGNCQEYLVCLNGRVEVKSCPSGWLFNAELGMCDDAGEEVCFHGTTTTEAGTTTSSTTEQPVYDLCIGQLKGTSFPYTENCHMYYYCRGNGSYYLVSCPFENYYEPNSGDCGPEVSPTACKVPLTTTTTAATTLSPAEKCEGQSMGDTFTYEINCRQYIMCMGGGRYQIVNCPANNFYYPDSGNCGPSADEDICRKKPETVTTTSTTTTEVTTTTTTTTAATTTTTTASSTEAPSNGICGNLTNGELITYPDNCQKYISCVRPIPIGFYCPTNWYFQLKQQQCVPDYNGACTEQPSNTTIAPPVGTCATQEKGEWQIYPHNCEMYYECLGNGYYMLKICTQGEYFDPLSGKCSRDVDANYCQQDFDTTTATTPTATPKPPQNLCWQKPIGSKIPYPQECSKYIVCELPIPVGYNCPKDLQFSSVKGECVDPENSDCGSIITPTAEPIPTTPTPPVTQCSGKPDLTLLPFEKDCSLFIICVKNMEHVAYCNSGQYFDSLLGECSSEANENSCLADLTTTTEITTKSTTTTLEPPTTIDPNLGPCYGKPEGTKLPYPNNCEKYIVCQNPIPVGYDCPAGLEFSEALSECVRPEMANCSIKTTTATPTITTPSHSEITCEGVPDGTTLTNPNDCSKYYICLNGTPRLTKCMANSYYNPASGQCDSSSETSCRDTTEPATTVSSNTSTASTPTTTTEHSIGPCSLECNGYTYPNVKECSQYYTCLSGSAYLTNCPSNSYYNPEMRECNDQTSSEACKDSGTEATTQETSTATTTTTSTLTTTVTPTITKPTTTEATTEETSVTPTITKPTTTEAPRNDNICCGKVSGTILPYPEDNTKYVICLYPLPQVAECPYDTLFDTTTGKCESKDHVVDMPQCLELPYGSGLAYEGDCRKFYVCFGCKAMVMTCAESWLFNASLGSCVPSQLYNCPW